MNYQNHFNDAIPKLEEAIAPLRSSCFLESCEEKLIADGMKFSLDENIEIEKCPSDPGIYLFWAQIQYNTKSKINWDRFIENFCLKWDKPAADIICHPKSNKSNRKIILENYNSNDWLPFYLGKSKNIQSRISEHINLSGDKTTYALKLRARKEELVNVNFEVVSIPFEIDEMNYFIIELIETELRKIFNPIIGKQ